MKKWFSFVFLGIYFFGWANFAQAELETQLPHQNSRDPSTLPASLPTLPVSNLPLSTMDEARVRDLLAKKKWPEAIALLQPLLERNPRSVPLRIGLVTALTYSGNRVEALGFLSEGVRQTQGKEHQFFMRRLNVLSSLFLTNRTFQVYQDGLNLMMGKKFRAARERFEKALMDEPDNVEILARLGQSFLLDNEPGKALPVFLAVRKLDSFQPQVRLWLGRTLFQLNQISDAIADLTIAHRELIGSELAPTWLAEALIQVGQLNAAIRLLEADVKSWPFHLQSLLSLSRFRLLGPHLDSQTLWMARKDLQLAASRVDQMPSVNDMNYDSVMLEIDLSRSSGDVKTEIQKSLQHIENRLSQLNNQR